MVVESDNYKLNSLKEVLDNLQFKGKVDYAISRGSLKTYLTIGNYDFILAGEEVSIETNGAKLIKTPNLMEMKVMLFLNQN